MEARYLRKNGSTLWVNLTASCVYDRDGTVKYVVKIIENITARKDIEIERAWSPTHVPRPPMALLDRAERIEQRMRIVRPLDRERAVEDQGLIRWSTDGRGLDRLRPHEHATTIERSDALDGKVERALSIAKVGAEPDDDLQGVLPTSCSGFVRRPW